MSTKDDIRNNLVALIETRGIKKADLARSLGISKSAVTNWTNGTNSIDIELVPGICAFFDISIDEFLSTQPRQHLSSDEQQLVKLYRSMPRAFQTLLTENAQAYALAASKREEPAEEA